MKKLSVFIAFAFILVSSAVSCFPGKPNIYIFNDISECENISFLKYENSILYRYENPSSDTYLRKLSYVEYFAARYESDELEFEIFAYVFENSETAMQYFENVTGKNDNLSVNFSISSGVGLLGVSSSEIVVIDGKCAYTVFTPRNQLEETKRALGEIFSKKLDF